MSEPAGLGAFEGREHVLPLRIYYEDTDLSGLVYHANYLRYMERGRTEFFRLAGVALTDMGEGEASAWAIRSANIQYHRPARLDDALQVRTRLAAISGARIEAAQGVWCGSTLLVEGRIEACIVTLTGRPRRIPQAARDLLTPFLVEIGS